MDAVLEKLKKHAPSSVCKMKTVSCTCKGCKGQINSNDENFKGMDRIEESGDKHKLK